MIDMYTSDLLLVIFEKQSFSFSNFWLTLSFSIVDGQNKLNGENLIHTFCRSAEYF